MPSQERQDSEKNVGLRRQPSPRDTFPLLLAALVMIYAAWFIFTPPQVKNLFTLGDSAFNWTLRIGAAILLVAFFLQLLRIRGGPLASALSWLAVGIGLCGSTVLMFAGGARNLNQIVYIMLGCSSLKHGYGLLKERDSPSPEGNSTDSRPDHRSRAENAARAPTADVTNAVKREMSGNEPLRPRLLAAAPRTDAPSAHVQPEVDEHPAASPAPVEGGFLASFATKKPPKN